MLKSFRNASNSLIIKILFGAIIFSFCLWGIGDIIKNYSASKSVFTVDKAKVSVETFIRQYNQEKQRIRNIGSKPLSDEEMKKLHIDKLVLDKMVEESVLDQAFYKLNIIVPKKSVLSVIQTMPQFQNNGVFSEEIYATAIKRAGISEAGFLMQIRENLAKTQLFQPLMSGYRLPNIIKDIMEKDFEINKNILLAQIKLSDIKIDKKPSETELKEFYESNKETYKNPESRDCSILVIDYRNLSTSIKVSKEEIDRYYEENKESYIPKELRDFERFSFENKEDADKAWNMMNKGTPSKNIIKKFTPDMENIRQREKSDFPKEIGDTLFKLKLLKTSAVYPIGGKFYIYRLVNIEKAKTKSEKEIKAEIEIAIQNEKMNTPEFYTKIKEMKNRIDDGFGSGKSIEAISKETGMNVVNLKGLKKDSDNQELQNIIADEDTRSDVLEAAFSTDENQASQTIDSRETDTLSYVVYTTKITPAQIPQYEKISDIVKNDFINNEKKQIITDKINNIMQMGNNAAKEVSKLNNVQKFKVSKKSIINYEKENSTEVKKLLKEIPNPGGIIEILSSVKVGSATHFVLENGNYLVIAINNAEQPKSIDAEFAKNISKYIDTTTANDIISLAMDAFKKTMKINIDSDLIAEITKTSDEEENNN